METNWIIEKIANLPQEKQILGDMLRKQIDHYQALQAEIVKHGYLIETKNGLRSNPAIKLANESERQITKLLVMLHTGKGEQKERGGFDDLLNEDDA